MEDQSHISLFLEAAPDSTVAATNADSLEVVEAITAFPEARFMWSLTSSWGRVRRAGRQRLARARPLDGADVWGGVRSGVSSTRAAGVPAR